MASPSLSLQSRSFQGAIASQVRAQSGGKGTSTIASSVTQKAETARQAALANRSGGTLASSVIKKAEDAREAYFAKLGNQKPGGDLASSVKGKAEAARQDFLKKQSSGGGIDAEKKAIDGQAQSLKDAYQKLGLPVPAHPTQKGLADDTAKQYRERMLGLSTFEPATR